MKKSLSALLVVVLLSLIGGSAFGADNSKPVILVWYPNESVTEMKEARDEVAAIVKNALGRKVEQKLTTDYVIAIEALGNKNATLGLLGPQGYVEAHDKNAKVLPLVVNSGASGTLNDALYYSWLNVKKGNEDQYKSGSGYSLDKIAGKRFGFVSNSSTSGFKVPSNAIVTYFKKKPAWSKLEQSDLIEGGKDKFFKEVLYGGSHQGSMANLLMDKVDVAAFCDTCVFNYIDLISGTQNKAGAVYRIKDKADEPFNAFPGVQFVSIVSIPVLNSPFVVNTDMLSKAEVDKLVAALTSDATTNNQKVFVPSGSSFKGVFSKKGNERFLKVEDAWYDPIRELSK
jgi:phosphonate transport system substrate-binding protein